MIASNDIILTKEKLGFGFNSNVFTCLIQDEKYAIKVYKQNVSHLARCHEIEIMQSLNHENILRLISYDKQQIPTYIVTDLGDKYDLLDYLRESQQFPTPIARFLFSKLLCAVQYMHEKGFAHRDLKPENVVFSHVGFVLKLADFGLTIDTKTQTNAPRNIGTGSYQAPELQTGEKYIQTSQLCSCDIYSLGIMLFIIVMRFPPFKFTNPKKCFWKKLLDCRLYEDYWIETKQNHFPKSFKDLFQGMIGPAEHRFTTQQVLESDWMKEEMCSFEEYQNAMQSRRTTTV